MINLNIIFSLLFKQDTIECYNYFINYELHKIFMNEKIIRFIFHKIFLDIQKKNVNFVFVLVL